MGIYSGNPVEQSYAHGYHEGYAWGERDQGLGLGMTSAGVEYASENARTASSRPSRAFAIGYLRGYREAVRTLGRDGRWGL